MVDLLKRNAKAVAAAVYSGLLAAQMIDWSQVGVREVLTIPIAMLVGGGLVQRIPNKAPE